MFKNLPKKLFSALFTLSLLSSSCFAVLPEAKGAIFSYMVDGSTIGSDDDLKGAIANDLQKANMNFIAGIDLKELGKADGFFSEGLRDGKKPVFYVLDLLNGKGLLQNDGQPAMEGKNYTRTGKFIVFNLGDGIFALTPVFNTFAKIKENQKLDGKKMKSEFQYLVNVIRAHAEEDRAKISLGDIGTPDIVDIEPSTEIQPLRPIHVFPDDETRIYAKSGKIVDQLPEEFFSALCV